MKKGFVISGSGIFAAMLLSVSFLAARAQAESATTDSGTSWYSKIIPLTKIKFQPVAPTINSRNIKKRPAALLGGAHIMRLIHKKSSFAGNVSKPNTVAPLPHLNYYGGPLLGNVNVVIVYWNKSVDYRSEITGFYDAVSQSPYFDWLREYNTPTADIGRGGYVADYTDDSSPMKPVVEDADIQQELSWIIKKQVVPATDSQTLYMVYFPPKVTIDLNGEQSCQSFCAYHNTFKDTNGQEINYGVIPDLGGACADGCGGPSRFNNLTSVYSHELTEAMTDVAVGLATGQAPSYPLAWYAPANGEIADICVGTPNGNVSGYAVQRVWSNHRGLCVASEDDKGFPAPTDSMTSGSGNLEEKPNPKVVSLP